MELNASNILDAFLELRSNLRQEYLYLLLNKIPPRSTDCTGINRMYQFHFPEEGNFYAMLLRASCKQSGHSVPDTAMTAAKALTMKALAEHVTEYEALVQNNTIFLVCATTEGPKTHMAQLNALLQLIRRECDPVKYEWTMGVGKFIPNVQQLNDSLFLAEHAIRFSVVEGSGRLYDGNQERADYDGGLTLINSSEQARLRNLVLRLNRADITDYLHDLFSEKLPQIKSYPVFAYMLSMQILQSVLQVLRDNMPVDRTTFRMAQDMEKAVDHQCTLSELISYTIHCTLELMDRYRLYSEQGASKPVWVALNYIQEHYKEPITLKDVAREARRNPQYLSAIFSRECGFTVIDYITSLRLECASQLLRNTDRSIDDISSTVGYRDAKYFSRLFAHAKGLSPTKFRSQARTHQATGK